MAKRKAQRKETKSDFLRKALSVNPELEYRDVVRMWSSKGHPGTISNALYYHVRAELGIKTEWVWVKADEAEALDRGPDEVYQFKITLVDSKPPIWRRIQVADCTLDKLHEHIQTAMGWLNSHLNQFRIGSRIYVDPMLMQETFDELDCADSTTTKLSEILAKKDKQFHFAYEYDFGDGWQHDIQFEGCFRADPAKRYPLCLAGARNCPPEDVGGIWAYGEFLDAIKDETHQDHDEMLEWVGGEFDPEAFDVSAATWRMKEGLPDWRNMD